MPLAIIPAGMIRSMTEKLSLWRRIGRNAGVYAALVPTFAFIAVFLLYPAGDAVGKSFYYWKMSDYNHPEFIGLQNYADLLRERLFWKSFGVLAIFISWGLVTLMGVLVPITYLVYKLGEYGAGRLIQRLYVIPMIIPSIVFILYWRFFYETNYGMLNNALKMIGLEAYTRVWLGEAHTALPALLFQGFPWVEGFGFLVILAGFQSIDRSLHESAEMDGASSFVKFVRIDLPLIVPQLKILIMLGMIGGIQQFALQLIMTKGGPNYATTVPGLLMYQYAFIYGNLGYGATMGVMLFVVILTITVLFNIFIKKAD